MIEKIVKEMTLKEKVGQLNQHLYGWQCYQKVNGKYELTDLFKEHVKEYGGVGAIYGIYVLMPGLRSIEKMELAVKIVKLSLQ